MTQKRALGTRGQSQGYWSTISEMSLPIERGDVLISSLV